MLWQVSELYHTVPASRAMARIKPRQGLKGVTNIALVTLPLFSLTYASDSFWLRLAADRPLMDARAGRGYVFATPIQCVCDSLCGCYFVICRDWYGDKLARIDNCCRSVSINRQLFEFWTEADQP